MKQIFKSVIRPAALLGIVSIAHGVKPIEAAPKKKLNVLFIAIDDLRPHLGCYGFDYVKSPNIDKVAANGLLFTRAYCQMGLSSPSRTSLLTGLNPDVTGITTIGPHFRDSLPDVVTLPQYFKQNGYFTQGFGKVYHNGLDDPKSWSVPHDPGNKPRYTPEGQSIMKRRQEENNNKGIVAIRPNDRAKGPPFESYDCEDNYFLDGGNAESAIKALERIKDTAFFLAVGFANPHIPYVSPKRYWDMYSSEKIALPLNQFPPDGAPGWALQSLAELNSYYNVPDPLTDDFKRELIRGYIAATSYVDSQVGLLIEALKKYKLLDNTIIVIWGDNGYQLGQHSMWSCKHTNYETSVLVPLIISIPGMKSKGEKSASLIEFTDIYPSLAEICGFKIPSHCQGRSFKALVDDPDIKINQETFNQYQKGGYKGYSIRNDRYRLVQWTKDKEIVYELYDHVTDPDENKNIASDPLVKSTINVLSKRINARIKSDKELKNLMTHQ
jgi:iduronate 2-sulfatase